MPRALVLMWGAVGLLAAASAVAAPRVQVRGSSRIELRAIGTPQEVRISGVLRDEVGTPIGNAHVVLSAQAAPDVPIGFAQVRACASRSSVTVGGPAEHPVMTDDYGAFCVEAGVGRSEATIRAIFGGDALHEGTRADVPWDAGLREVGLMFAPRPERVDLDMPRALVFGRLTAPEGVSPAQREVTLEDDHARVLGTTRTDPSGALHVDVPSSSFDGPGFGRLRLRFAGNDELAAAEETVTIVRSARVRMELEGAHVRGDPARGVGFVVRVSTSRGAVEGGTVEATWGNAAVGAARVENGRARVVATFTPGRDTETTELTLRYAAEAPYYDAGPPVPVTLTVSPARPWMRALPALAAIAVAIWLVRGWRRPPRRASAAAALRSGIIEPSVTVIGAARARGTWTGKVVDAHDGAGIGGARVRVIAPSFADLDVVAEVGTAADGEFELGVRTAERELRLRVEAPLHADLERPLPPASHLVIAMVSRRRALLDRLVGWARRAGKPWDKAPEPTPGHVVRVALGQRHPRDDIGVWARRVEQRVYGPEVVDATAEREVSDIEPRGPAAR